TNLESRQSYLRRNDAS
ncbi:hypothetical protein Areg01_89830, partial [Actinoplanes regularis]